MTKQADKHIDDSSTRRNCAGTDVQRTSEPHKLVFVSENRGAEKPELKNHETEISELETIEEKWEKAGIGNAFIFGKVMSENRGLLLELLQLSLPEFEITELVEPAKEVALKPSYDSKGVRLDIRVLDIRGRIFNVEMQLRDEKNIPIRIRFYSSTLDTTILKTGEDYNKLSDAVVLFITTFDPFSRNRYRYTFRNICVEDRELELEDGTSKIILNASASVPEKKKGINKNKPADMPEEIVSDELGGFLRLVMGTKPPEGADTFAGRVQKSVEIAKRDSATRREFMNWEMTLTVERNKGKVEGRAEGRGEGELLKLINQILKKSLKGQSAERISDDLMEEPALVNQILRIASQNSLSDPDEILNILKAGDGGRSDAC